jgi:drug/metabolite transporter (DMT)-like permease
VRSRALPLLLLAVPLLAWGTGYRATAVAETHTPALTFAALRAIPSIVVGLLLLGIYRGRVPRGRSGLLMAANGLLMVSLFVWALTEGVARAGAANTSVLVSTSPLFVAILSRIAFDEGLPPRRVAGLVCGFAGVATMFSSELRIGGGQVALGMAIAVVAGLAWATGTIVVKRAGRGLDPVSVTGLQYVVGAPILFAVAFAARGTEGTEWSSGELWAATAYVGIGGLVGSLAFFAALRLISATETTTVQFAIPVVAVLVEVIRGNTPSAVSFAGMALAVAGVGLVLAPGRVRRVVAPSHAAR